jgi:hypothetical protein
MSQGTQSRVVYTDSGKRVLKCLVEKYIHIVENKKTNKVSQRQKDEAWAAIAREYNQEPDVSHRNAKSLHKAWDNMKTRTKEEVISKFILSTHHLLVSMCFTVHSTFIFCRRYYFQFRAEKTSLYRTGGGEASAAEPSELSQSVRALVSGQIDPLNNPYDCDGKNLYIIAYFNKLLISITISNFLQRLKLIVPAATLDWKPRAHPIKLTLNVRPPAQQL